jgi:hypothetical protein
MRWLLPLALAVCACSSSSSSTTSSASSSGTTAQTPKLRTDVMPLLGQNCALAACHGSSASNLGIYISFDPEQVYAQLMKDSPTAKMKFVVPGDAKSSYLMMKLDGTQCATCGAPMPLDLPQLSQAQRDTVRAWINGGAKDD